MFTNRLHSTKQHKRKYHIIQELQVWGSRSLEVNSKILLIMIGRGS